MSNDYLEFDSFVDDIISSDNNLLKGELDILLMQHLFNSVDLENFKNLGDDVDYYKVA